MDTDRSVSSYGMLSENDKRKLEALAMNQLDEKDLTTKARKALPKKSFALPGKAPKSGSYPIPDKSHARNALARVSQHGTPSEKKRVRAAVHRKFPGIGEDIRTSLQAERIVAALLEDDDDREEQIEIGTEIEKEHFTKGGKPKDKTPRQVATTHVDENPKGKDYYPEKKKPKGAGEKLTWTK